MRQAPESGLPVKRPVVIAKIVGAFGVQGWVKVRSFTDPVENALNYQPWYLRQKDRWMRVELLDARVGDKLILTQLAGFVVREEVMEWSGAEIVVERSLLPEPEADEYYWTDLIGLRVVTVDGVDFGLVDQVLETGANDVLVVRGERERLVPFISGQVVKEVDLAAGQLTVEWDPDF